MMRRFGPPGCRLLALLLVGGVACGDDDDSAGADAGDGGTAAAHDAVSAADVAPEAEGPVVRVSSGWVEGEVIGGAERFLAIPYAAPPVGELRWRAPAAPEPWEGLRSEREFASPCPQQASQQSPESTDEDCLYLNVWRPAEPVEDAPVMFWIHGGGNRTGSAADVVPLTTDHLWYDGRVFAERHGIVVVTINYRLGAFGFFAHPALQDEGSPRGNQGLLDQVFALRWVQENIARFGGDPDNVTIFGESAGSASVCLHVASPMSRGLFHRAISQSGGCVGRGAEDRERTDAALTEWASERGCEGDDVLACLRGKPVEELIDLTETNRSTGMTGGPNIFRTVLDGEFLPEPAAELYARGEVAQVPYILGSNSEEGMLYFALSAGPADDDEYMAALQERFGDAAAQVQAMYPPTRFDGDYKRALARAVGDSGLVCGTHETARAAAAAGLEVYMYNFNIAWSISRDLLGPTHASEISHVFGTPYDETPDNAMVAEEMNAYWARMARTGDPNGEGAPAAWPRFVPTGEDDDERLQLDPAFDILPSFRKEECAMWRELNSSEP